MDQLEYAYPDHVLEIQPSEFAREIVRGVFGKEALPRPLATIEFPIRTKQAGCNPIILTALAEIKEGLQELKAPAPEPKPPGSLLSVSEVALIIGITEDTVRKWARAGKIASVRLSKVDVRFRPADVDEFIGSRLHRRKSAFRSP